MPLDTSVAAPAPGDCGALTAIDPRMRSLQFSSIVPAILGNDQFTSLRSGPAMTELLKPPFISSQEIYRLALTPAQRANAKAYLLGGKRSSPEPLAPESRDTRPQPPWRLVDRKTYLSSVDHRLTFLTVEAGFGKSTALAQAQQLLHARQPGRLAVRLEMRELKKGAWRSVVKHVRTWFQHQNQSSTIGRPGRKEVSLWLLMLIRRGKFSLLIDGLDETSSRDIDAVTRELRSLLERRFPKLHCLIAGRPYAIEDHWDTLFRAGPNANSASHWEFARVAQFTTTQCQDYLGDRFAFLQRIGASELFVPRTLDIIRTMEEDEIRPMRNSADVYWHSVRKTISLDKEPRVKERDFRLKLEEIVDLLSAIAFILVSWRDGPELGVAGGYNEFAGRVHEKLLTINEPPWSSMRSFRSSRKRWCCSPN